MTDSAQVHSIEAIERFYIALAEFESKVQATLDTLDGELQRAVDWLQHDAPAHWKQQEKVAANAVHQAKLDLEHCLAYPIAGEHPACREERAALKKAQLRWDYCREKRERVKHWQRVLHHELYEYQGRVGHLRKLLETDLPKARARLRQIVRRLDAYRIERPPEVLKRWPPLLRETGDTE